MYQPFLFKLRFFSELVLHGLHISARQSPTSPQALARLPIAIRGASHCNHRGGRLSIPLSSKRDKAWFLWCPPPPQCIWDVSRCAVEPRAIMGLVPFTFAASHAKKRGAGVDAFYLPGYWRISFDWFRSHSHICFWFRSHSHICFCLQAMSFSPCLSHSVNEYHVSAILGLCVTLTCSLIWRFDVLEQQRGHLKYLITPLIAPTIMLCVLGFNSG